MAYFEEASDVLRRANVIGDCEIHGYEVLIDEGRLTTAYKIGAKMVKAGEVGADHVTFMEAIKSAVGDYGDCIGCRQSSSHD